MNPSTDLHFTKDDSYSRLYQALLDISNASYEMLPDMPKHLKGYQYKLDCATREAWAILRDEVEVDPVRQQIRGVVEDEYTSDDERMRWVEEILDGQRTHVNVDADPPKHSHPADVELFYECNHKEEGKI